MVTAPPASTASRVPVMTCPMLPRTLLCANPILSVLALVLQATSVQRARSFLSHVPKTRTEILQEPSKIQIALPALLASYVLKVTNRMF